MYFGLGDDLKLYICTRFRYSLKIENNFIWEPYSFSLEGFSLDECFQITDNFRHLMPFIEK